LDLIGIVSFCNDLRHEGKQLQKLCRLQDGYEKSYKKLFSALDSVLGCVLSQDSKTLCHYSLKALQICQNHLRLSF
jgi:hypothetical protein